MQMQNKGTPGLLVYYYDPQGIGHEQDIPEDKFFTGRIISVNDQTQTVDIKRDSDAQEILAVPLSKVFLRDPFKEQVDDITSMTYLHDPALLQTLCNRYEEHEIYTYAGAVLIAINPYRQLTCYDDNAIERYRDYPELKKLSPHVFAIAEDAYRKIKQNQNNQSILVSGESGAGKTETTKHILKYLAAMQSKHGLLDKIAEKILTSTPVLEAFGNAKTSRNDNSSRFGKFIEVQFHNEAICGANIKTYLLEKSRITRQLKNERNYHIFYQLIAGAPSDLRGQLGLQQVGDYRYLNQSGCTTIENVNDAKMFSETLQAMKVFGIDDNEISFILKVVAAVLHLGNIQFKTTAQDTAAIESDAPLKLACNLLQIDAAEVLSSILYRFRFAPNNPTPIASPLTVIQASAARDSLSMLLYSRLFDWVVAKINNSMSAPQCTRFIGILDIYGFESFEKNSFEQFCINWANEKLQQHYNNQILKQSQEDYVTEGIDWSHITFNDNQQCIDLIEGKTSIVSVLNDQCNFENNNDNSFGDQIIQRFAPVKTYFTTPRIQQAEKVFSINHYAASVPYCVTGFIDKNKDYLIQRQITILANADLGQLKQIFVPLAGNAGNAQLATVASQFKTSLAELMQKIMKTNPNFIRCIKPNVKKVPGLFYKKMIHHQLACGGIMESVRIYKEGYPTKIPFLDFALRYKECLTVKENDFKLASDMICKSCNIAKPLYQIGRSKIFLAAGQIEIIAKTSTDIRNAVLSCQSILQAHRAKTYFQEVERYKKQQQMEQHVLQVHADFVQVQAEKKVLSDQIAFATAQLTEAQDSVATLKQQVESMTIEQATLTKTVQTITAQRDDSTRQVSELLAKISELNQQAASILETSAREQKSLKEESAAKINKLEAENKHVTQKLSLEQVECSKYSDQVKQLLLQVQLLQSTKDSQAKVIEELLSENAVLKASISTVSAERDSLISQITQKNQDVAATVAQLKERSAKEAKEFKEREGKHLAQIEKLLSEMKQQEQAAAQAKQASADEYVKLEKKSAAEADSLQAIVQAKTQEIQTAQELIKKREEELREARGKIAQVEDEAKNLSQKMAALASSLTQEKQEREVDTKKRDEEAKQLRAQIHQLQATRDAQAKQLSSAQHMLASNLVVPNIDHLVSAKLVNLDDKIAKLKHHVQQLQVAFKRDRSILDATRNEKDVALDKILSFEREKERIKQRNALQFNADLVQALCSFNGTPQKQVELFTTFVLSNNCTTDYCNSIPTRAWLLSNLIHYCHHAKLSTVEIYNGYLSFIKPILTQNLASTNSISFKSFANVNALIQLLVKGPVILAESGKSYSSVCAGLSQLLASGTAPRNVTKVNTCTEFVQELICYHNAWFNHLVNFMCRDLHFASVIIGATPKRRGQGNVNEVYKIQFIGTRLELNFKQYLQQYKISPAVMRQAIGNVCEHLDCEAFNELLKRSDLRVQSNVPKMLLAIQTVEGYINSFTALGNHAPFKLRRLRQACELINCMDKNQVCNMEFRRTVIPNLNAAQIKGLITAYNYQSANECVIEPATIKALNEQEIIERAPAIAIVTIHLVDDIVNMFDEAIDIDVSMTGFPEAEKNAIAKK